MLATRMIALCDHAGCKARTKGTITMNLKAATKGIQNPIVLSPNNFIFKEDGWSWGWNGDETKFGCPDHSVVKR